MSARKSPSPSEWLVYRVGGRKATHLGTVKAVTMEEAIAAAAAEFGVPPVRILVQQVGHAEPKPVRRGEIIGERVGGEPATEAVHFIKCPDCGGWVDMRDLGQVLEHAGPLPHPAQDRAQ